MRDLTIARYAAALLLLVTPPLHAQQQVTVLTSFPKELTAAYKAAFEKANPGTRVEILNKGTSAAVAYVRETRPGERPDVFWASAPDAFEVLAKDGLLEKYDPGVKGIPEKIGSYPVNDPRGFYRGQALAGYGLMWNTRYLAANKVPAPKEWADLVKPVYFSHVAISSPSRSGTTHLTVETILQGEGWEKGWSQILQIAGNCAAITERSFGVPDGVSNGQFGIGLVIEPRVLLLDEPLSNLDAKLRHHMRRELLAMQRKLGITTIFVTHDQEEAMTTADRIAVMDQGVVQQVGSPVELYDAPANRFVAEFVGTVNLVSAAEPAFAALAAGASATALVAFRPHSVLVAERPGDPSRHWVETRVAEREFLGEFVRYRLHAGERELIADQPHALGDAGFAPGARVSLGIERSQVRVLKG